MSEQISNTDNSHEISKHVPPSTTASNSEQTDARMAQIEEILGHTAMRHLDKCELVAEWIRRAEAKVPVSGQVVHKPKGGRPEGGIARAARELPVPGKTVGARRQFIKRALDVDSIWPAAKSAARAANLDDIQLALLDIARERSLEDQLAKVKEIKVKKAEGRRNRRKAVQPATADDAGNPTGTGLSIPEANASVDQPLTAAEEALLAKMQTEWMKERVLWRDDWENGSAAFQRRVATDVLFPTTASNGSEEGLTE